MHGGVGWANARVSRGRRVCFWLTRKAKECQSAVITQLKVLMSDFDRATKGVAGDSSFKHMTLHPLLTMASMSSVLGLEHQTGAAGGRSTVTLPERAASETAPTVRVVTLATAEPLPAPTTTATTTTTTVDTTPAVASAQTVFDNILSPIHDSSAYVHRDFPLNTVVARMCGVVVNQSGTLNRLCVPGGFTVCRIVSHRRMFRCFGPAATTPLQSLTSRCTWTTFRRSWHRRQRHSSRQCLRL